MDASSAGFLDFLEGIYGKAAIDQIETLSGLERKDIEAASEAFTPAFLQGLMSARSKSHALHTGPGAEAPSFANFWPAEITDAMQNFMTESAKAAKTFAPASGDEAGAFPFNVLASQSGQLEKLQQVFLGQIAQVELMDGVSQTTGIPQSQLKTLLPMLTAFGLMPLMQQAMPHAMAPSMDNPAGWVDYLGNLGRRQFRQANKDLDAMPNPMNAAFEGLLSGLFPQPKEATLNPAPAEPDHAQQVRDASLELQTNYIRGLNTLFERYAKGIKGDTEDT